MENLKLGQTVFMKNGREAKIIGFGECVGWLNIQTIDGKQQEVLARELTPFILINNKQYFDCTKYGSAYALVDGEIWYVPKLVAGGYAENYEGIVEEAAFAKDEEQVFVDEMVKLFGEEVLKTSLIKNFKNVSHENYA